MHQLPIDFLETCKNSIGKQLLTVVCVHWAENPIYYSEQEILWDSKKGLYTFPALLELNQLDIAGRIDNQGTSLSFGITLDDSDGHIDKRLNYQPLTGIQVDVYLHWVGFEYTSAFLVGTGLVNSDTIAWDEPARTITFSVEQVLDSKNVSYIGTDGMDDQTLNPKHSFEQAGFPFVFGSPINTQTLSYIKPQRATCSSTRAFGFPFSAYKAYILTNVQGFPYDEDLSIGFFNPYTNVEVGLAVTGRIHPFTEESWIFVDNVVYPALAQTCTFADRDPNDPRYLDFTYFWVTENPAGNSLWSYYLNFADVDGKPSLIAPSVVLHDNSSLVAGTYIIKLSHQPRWFNKKAERSVSLGFDYKTWTSKFTLSNDGAVREDIKVLEVAEAVRFAWICKSILYTRIDKDGVQELEDVNNIPAPLHENKKYNATSSHASLTIPAGVADIASQGWTAYETIFSPEGVDEQIQGESAFTWTFVDNSKLLTPIDPIVRVEDVDTHSFVLRNPNSPNLQVVVNIFPTLKHSDTSPRCTIRAVSGFNHDHSLSVPDASNTVTYKKLIPYHNTDQTVVETPQQITDALTGGTGELLATCETAYFTFDKYGEPYPCDTSNAVDVISWLAKVYAGLNVDDKTDTYKALRERVYKTKIAFMINTEIPALQLMAILAWENRIALGFFGKTLTLTDLTVEPTAVMTFNKSNIQLQGFSKSYTKSTNLFTQFKFGFQANKETEGEVITFRNNSTIYGLKTFEANILSLDKKEDVLELIKFWGNRMSRAWRTVKIKTGIEALKLQVNDAIEIDLPIFSTHKVIGFVDSVRYVPSNFNVELEITMASDASSVRDDLQPFTDTSYWVGLPSLNLITGNRLVSNTDAVYIAKKYVPIIVRRPITADYYAIATSG